MMSKSIIDPKCDIFCGPKQKKKIKNTPLNIKHKAWLKNV